MDTPIPRYISHVRTDAEQRIVALQSNADHSRGVAELARDFAAPFGMAEWGHVLGLLHDKGKEKAEFQRYIRFACGLTSTPDFTQEGKAHAYVGGQLARQLYPPMLTHLLANPLMGHHRGLYDHNAPQYEALLAAPLPAELQPEDFPPSLPLPPWFAPGTLRPEDIHHVERMLYSCLVDADYLDTERFMQPEQHALRGGHARLSDLLPRLEAHLARFGEPATEVARVRCEVQQACRAASERPPGCYSLTVPTGGGKTLASLLWAMRHAVRHGLQRIVIAIPYTSIIVQTAAVLREIFGAANVLEHHSNLAVETAAAAESTEGSPAHMARLATENWDYPIIVTTNVQLFESMMAHRSSSCRKLHNLCRSVIILDEAQCLPTDFLQPILDTLDTYRRLFGVSLLLTTASQPVLVGRHGGTTRRGTLDGLPGVEEIIPPASRLHERLRRVDLSIDSEPRTYDEVADRLARHDRVLCIVNTRRDAQAIYERLPQGEGLTLHLSRMMCPAHVDEGLRRLREALADPDSGPVRVVSTQLIEAGVDIDFPTVYRQEAGLDSLLQAAGRCNREGRQPIATTHVFSLAAEHPLPPGFISRGNAAFRALGQSEADWFAPATMTRYFLQLYSRIADFDKRDIGGLLYREDAMFETAATAFRLIDDATVSVVVHWGEAPDLLQRLRREGPSYSLLRQLSRYSVNLRRHDFDQMARQGLVQEVACGIYEAPDLRQYHAATGLTTANRFLEETFIV